MTRILRVGLLLACVAGAGVACGDDEKCTIDATGEETDDCDGGVTGDGQACTCENAEDGGGDGTTITTSNTTARVLTGAADALTVTVPDNATSVALIVEGLGSRLLLADKITSPSGTVVFDFQNDVNTNLSRADDEVYTVIIPNNPEVELEAGDWKVQFFTDAAQEFEIAVKGVFQTGEGSDLDVNLVFVGVDGLDAAGAESDAAFQAVLSDFERVYAKGDVDLGEVRYFDAPEAAADEFGTLSDTALSDLFEIGNDLTGADGASAPARALTFYFVNDITGGDAGFSLLGLSGGVPGPPNTLGTRKSGVVVNMSDFADNPAAITTIMVHEGGHYLGLYHTTERNGQALDEDGITGTDHLSDTPVCPDDADTSGNGVLSASECADAGGNNLMFFSPPLDSPTDLELTAQQGQVMRLNPAVR